MRGAALVELSSAWATAPVGPPGQPPYLNAAALLRTHLPPRRLKTEVLRPIEERLGRHRGPDRYAPRTIDLDLIGYGDLVADEADLRLPDVDLARAVHLAVPAAEVAPDWRHPLSGQRLADIAAQLLAGLPEKQRPRRVAAL